jgi:hypothetical protein
MRNTLSLQGVALPASSSSLLAQPLRIPLWLVDSQAQMFSRSDSMPYRKKISPRPASPHRTALIAHEKLVNDVRAGLTPSQLMERRLIAQLRGTILPASHLQVSRARRALS